MWRVFSVIFLLSHNSSLPWACGKCNLEGQKQQNNITRAIICTQYVRYKYYQASFSFTCSQDLLRGMEVGWRGGGGIQTLKSATEYMCGILFNIFVEKVVKK